MLLYCLVSLHYVLSINYGLYNLNAIHVTYSLNDDGDEYHHHHHHQHYK